MKAARRFTAIAIVFFVVGSMLGAAFAAGAFSNNGNDRKGKYLYRKSCRACHDGSSATNLSPNSKTQAQWQRAFEKHERLECAGEWKKLSHKDLNDIYTYLYNHAYDSPQPATCQ